MTLVDRRLRQSLLSQLTFTLPSKSAKNTQSCLRCHPNKNNKDLLGNFDFESTIVCVFKIVPSILNQMGANSLAWRQLTEEGRAPYEKKAAGDQVFIILFVIFEKKINRFVCKQYSYFEKKYNRFVMKMNLFRFASVLLDTLE